MLDNYIEKLKEYINEITDEKIEIIDFIYDRFKNKKYIVGFDDKKLCKITIRDNVKIKVLCKSKCCYCYEYYFDENDKDIIDCINNLI